MVIFGSGYKNGYVSYTAEGGAIAVAMQGNTVWFKYSPDGAQWPSSATEVGQLASAKSAHCHQKYSARGSVLIVTDGIEYVWQSLDYGRTWSAI